MRFITAMVFGIWLFPGNILADIVFSNKSTLKVSIEKGEPDVVHTALEIFSKDYRRVFGQEVLNVEKAEVIIGTIGFGTPAEEALERQDVRSLQVHKEGYIMELKNGKLYILGSDKRGTAYGILELSRLIGVSPWEWWADSPVEKKEKIILQEGLKLMKYPSVAHRGIFLNDEDWGLTPWSYMTHEPSDIKGTIGPKTHARIFELLLRLRGNTFWPAMHACSVAFYQTPGNKEMADKYGIYVGTSHCEPMVRNTNTEWNRGKRGSYDYVNNRDSVLEFWKERIVELTGSDNIYTLGIRGEHDGKMLGANTVEEQKRAITNVLKDQRSMIAKYVNPNIEKVPQVFIPYKEVLDVYSAGLQVPEDVSLMWCDDNYGYIRHFPTAEERTRKGGNGIYYHVSYWGRPHDYLWLTTNHPAQLYTQLKMAYNKGAKDMWILNVGDIKPSEYLTELFMDMAWDINVIESNEKGLREHLHSWLVREFGTKYADELLPLMDEYYRLAYIRKPEFMGNTRTEEKDPAYKVVSDFPWSKREIETRIQDYIRISDKIVDLSKRVPTEKALVWFQLVEYPVRGAAEMNKKHLYAQLARHGLADWLQSDMAYDTIVSMTRKYNSMNNGKWNRIMSCEPRKLTVFQKVSRSTSVTPLPEKKEPIYLLNGKEYVSFKGEIPVCYGLGYQRGAIHLKKDTSVTYRIEAELPEMTEVEVTLAPNHPVEGKQIRYAISLNKEQPQVVDYHTEGRSEEWKQNVLSNQAVRKTWHKTDNTIKADITITALDEGVVIDQIIVRKKPGII